MKFNRSIGIVAANRLPIGKINGFYQKVTPEELYQNLIQQQFENLSQLKQTDVEQVILGNVSNLGGNLARRCALQAGFKSTIPAQTIDCQCGSSLAAIIAAANLISVHDASLVCTGSVESTSTANTVLDANTQQPIKRFKMVPAGFKDLDIGIIADLTAKRMNISRKVQDQYALTSHRKAAQQNYRVILTGRNSNLVQQRKEQLLQKFPASQVQSIVLDVCNRRMIKSVAQSLGKIDVLINNAGIIADNWWVNLSCQDWDRVIATNLTGAFNVTHYLTSHLKLGGQIIMLTSQSALLGNPGQSNYAASKAGIIGLTKTLALELKRFSLKVNCVAPAAITDMTRPVIEKIKQKHHGNLPAEWQLGSSQTVAIFIINYVLNSEKTGMIYAVNGAKIGYWEEPIFHQLTSKRCPE